MVLQFNLQGLCSCNLALKCRLGVARRSCVAPGHETLWQVCIRSRDAHLQHHFAWLYDLLFLLVLSRVSGQLHLQNCPGVLMMLMTCLMQIHMFLFYIALCHIICGYVMIRISSARVDIWRQWLLDDDAHSKA